VLATRLSLQKYMAMTRSVADVPEEGIPRIKAVIKGALDAKSLDKTRLYGARANNDDGGKSELPSEAGLTIGHNAAKNYLKKNCKSIFEATFELA